MKLLHLYAAEFRDAAQVIPAQVHKHIMFRQFLLILQQVLLQLPVLLRGSAPGVGSCQREGVQDAVFQLHQRFRAGSGHLHIRAGEVEHIGRRVYRAKRPVHVQQAALVRRAQPVGKNDLENIPLFDIMPRLFDHGAVFGPAEQGRDLPGQPAGFVLGHGAFRKNFLQLRQLQLRPVTAGLALFQPDIDDQNDFLAEVVKGNHLVKEHQVHILEMLGILRFPAGCGLGVIQIIVGEVTGQAAGEGRKLRNPRAFVFRQDLAQHGGGMIRFQLQIADLHFAVGAGNAQLRIEAQKGVAAPMLLRFRRLQQKAVGRNVFQLPDRLDRRADIRQQRAADRSHLIACRPVPGQLFPGGCDLHDSLSFLRHPEFIIRIPSKNP